MEALKSRQSVSALPILEWNGPVKYWWTQLHREAVQVSKCQLTVPNLISLCLLWKHNWTEIFFPLDTEAEKTVAQILKTTFLNSSCFVTSALISVWLTVLLFVNHIGLLFVKSWYSHCPEVLRKKNYGIGKLWRSINRQCWKYELGFCGATVWGAAAEEEAPGTFA